MTRLKRALLAAPLFLLAACAGVSTPSQPPVIGSWGFDLTAMDTTIAPGDDFYKYAGGTWMKTAQIPGDRNSWGSLAMVRDKSERDTREVLLLAAATEQAPGTIGQKVVDFDKAYQDMAAIEARGLAPIQGDLDAIAAAKTHDEIARLMGVPGLPGGPLNVVIQPDQKVPERYVLDIYQDGLGLPDRDYYLRDDKQFRDIRAAYEAYMAQALGMAGYPEPKKAAAAIMRLETDIAKIHWAIEKRRNLDLTYNPKTKAELEAFAPGFGWDAYLTEANVATADRFNLNESDAIQKLSAQFPKVPLSTWKAYMAFHTIDGFAQVLPKAYDDAAFAFASKVSGQREQRARWKRSIGAMSGAMGEALGQLYVEKHFSPEAKAAMIDLVENLRASYKSRIEALDWMSPETKTQALDKLAAFGVKIGYPDSWKDYSALEIRADDPVGNMKRMIAWDWQRQVARFDQPVDKTEWFMSPQTVNAYYNPSFNEIVFPAAILQPPFFDLGADPAVNYGGIASVIGHEFGHGFDDQGAKVDARGVLRNWWTPEDEKRFQERTKALAAQYAKFEPLPGLFVNGELTLGENIGDLGGLEVAYDAYLRSLDGKEAAVVDGFTGTQRFFLGFAQVRKTVYRDEALRNQVLSDPHSPNMYRVNGVVPNMDVWYDAFSVVPGQKMYLAPNQRVHIW